MSRIWIPAVAFALSACVTELDVPVDQDGDGLLNTEEEALGTDPEEDDSDGDGHTDGDEVVKGTDPLDIDDHPYFGEYPVDKCDEEPVSTGSGIGDIAPNFELRDAHADSVELYDFCGKVVWLVMGAFW